MSISIDQLKRRIIELVTHTEDREQLDRVYGSLFKGEQRSAEELRKELFASGGVKIGPAPTFAEIVQIQNRPYLSYSDINSIAEDIDWEFSLEDLLDMAD